MEEKNLYFLILGIFILFSPVLSVAMQKVDCAEVVMKQILTISQDISDEDDLEISDSNSLNSEPQIRILCEKIPVRSKILNYSNSIRGCIFNIKIQNQICKTITREYVTNYQCSSIFTGVFRI